jgi:hypothetical protein
LSSEVSCFLQNEEVFGQTDMLLFGFFYTRGISPEAERTANPVQKPANDTVGFGFGTMPRFRAD